MTNQRAFHSFTQKKVLPKRVVAFRQIDCDWPITQPRNTYLEKEAKTSNEYKIVATLTEEYSLKK